MAVPIEVIPGVTAASAAAAALGAPLMLDFAADQPQRSAGALGGHSPRLAGRRRRRPGDRPLQSPQQQAHPPVGGNGGDLPRVPGPARLRWASPPAAGQVEQSLAVTDLDHLLHEEIGMTQHRHHRQQRHPADRRLDGHGAGISAMILLLGGTGDSAEIALGLAGAGYRVLVSQATDVPLDAGRHARIESRCGALDESGLAELVAGRKIRAVVDATHPYAVTIRAHGAAGGGADEDPLCQLPAASRHRPAGGRRAVCPGPRGGGAAAFSFGQPVLLTTGAGNLAPYAEESRRTGLPLVVRVLERPASLAACRQAGIPDEHVVADRGPFSVEENRRQLRAFGIGVAGDQGQRPARRRPGKAPGGPGRKLPRSWPSAARGRTIRRPPPAWKNCCGRCGKFVPVYRGPAA